MWNAGFCPLPRPHASADTVAMSDNQERRARPLDEKKESSALVKYRAFMKAELARLRRDESGLESIIRST